MADERTTTNDIHPLPWERQPGESARVYDLFRRYMEMPPYRRSLRNMAREWLREVEGLDENSDPQRFRRRFATKLRQFTMYSSRWNWPERAAAWDDHVAEQAREELLSRIVEMRLRHAKIGQALQRVGYERIGQKHFSRELNPSQALRYIVEGVNIERLARGMATDAVDLTTAGEPLPPGVAVERIVVREVVEESEDDEAGA